MSTDDQAQVMHFDPAFHTKDVTYYSTTGYVDNSINTQLAKKLTDQLYKELGLRPALQYQPTTKENNMSVERRLRTPESPIEVKDLNSACRALGYRDTDEILDAVALVQSLTSDQRLMQGRNLKQQDIGCYVEIVDGQKGLLTDFNGTDEFRRNDGQAKVVLDGRMVSIQERDFLIVTTLAN